jgi:predicted nucleic acid-binding protein
VILFLDTSSLVKLYFDEEDSDEITRLVGVASVVAASVVAYAETRATIARRRRERLLGPAAAAVVVRQFDADWAAFLAIDVTETLARSAGLLADRFGLRGSDAIQLASFETLLSRIDADEAHFSSADARLVRAARKLGSSARPPSARARSARPSASICRRSASA